MITEFLKSFLMLLIIMDPFGGIPIFLSLTKDFSLKKVRESANRATLVAGMLIIVFIFLGKALLEFFGISVGSFKIAGGIILLIIGISYVLDLKFRTNKTYEHDITVPMATPLIAGAGVLTSSIILVSLYGFWIPLVAAIINLFIFWLLMRYSNYLHKIIGHQGAEILSRIMGLILAALAVEFVISGIISIFEVVL
ncbi:MAG: MarC family protein [Nanoarchaeota archaeon]|nr:MarC family protein [Nanoarchaeota archaeon]MBU1850517.1 MarC family protein [Nanoarchaeota archaeon]